jgi:hypothetical protein
MIRKFFLFVATALISVSSLLAREGMWIPTWLGKYNIEEMHQMGFRLTADDIYSVNHASMKDAVVLFGGGCTGELISGEGLLITNHHCGFDAIQNHSTVEHDYLTNGFWARNHQEELPNPGLSVRLLNRMEDVSEAVFAGTESKPKDSATFIINGNIKQITDAASEKGRYEAVVKPLFYGNQYFLYVYQVFTDVRLVGAPPSAIGKFGGDTDNWMWPRHTGDFSLFRIYANRDNQPASYSPDNVPYKPKKFFKISIKGIQPGDFTLVFGYPARTQEYLPSEAIEQIIDQGNPDKIKIRDLKLSILSSDMDKDAKVRIQYASKYASTSNAWKKWQGEVKGLKRLNAVEVKQKEEAEFSRWAASDPKREEQFGKVLPEMADLYKQLAPYSKAYDYYTEIVFRGTDLFSLISYFENIRTSWPTLKSDEQEKAKKSAQAKLREYFREYNQPTDERVFAALLQLFAQNMDPNYLPDDFVRLMKKSDQDKLKRIYRNSIFTDSVNLKTICQNLDSKKLEILGNDAAFKLYAGLKKQYETTVRPEYTAIQAKLDEAMKIYVKGIREMNAGKPLWPDANQSLRVSYGKVEGYEPMDGVTYDYYTTLQGVMEKDNPKIYDYRVPQRLRELYEKKEYGKYGQDGVMNVCFLASNHTSGGNSGSPVIDADGNLIGVNFDRVWEGTMSDLMFDPDRCRNIVLDIRYALFLIDRFAGAGYLIDEMQVVGR